MTISVGYLQKKIYTAKWDRQFIDDLLAPGIIGANDLLVTSTGTALGTSVAAGVTYVQGTLNVNQGLYRFFNDAAFGLTHVAAVTNPRWDRIIARVYDSTEAGSGSDVGTLEIIAGAENAGAATGNAVGSELGIASLAGINNCFEIARVLVPVGASPVIPGGNIRSVRAVGGVPKVTLGAAGGAAQAELAQDSFTPGVVGAGDGAISRISSSSIGIAAGSGWIRQADNALLRVTWLVATISGIPAAATNPRIDQYVVNSAGVVSSLAGSEQVGATLDNAAGVTSRAAIPNGSLLLGEALVKTSGAGIIGTVAWTDFRDRRTGTATAPRVVVASGFGNVPTKLNKGTQASVSAFQAFVCPPGMQAVITGFTYNGGNGGGSTSSCQLYINGSTAADQVGFMNNYASNGAGSSGTDILDAAAFYYMQGIHSDIITGGSADNPRIVRRQPIVLNPGDVLWAKFGAATSIGWTVFGYFTPVGAGFPKRLAKGTLGAATAATIYTAPAGGALIWGVPFNGTSLAQSFLGIGGTATTDRVSKCLKLGSSIENADPACVVQYNNNSGLQDTRERGPIPLAGSDTLAGYTDVASSYTVFGVEF